MPEYTSVCLNKHDYEDSLGPKFTKIPNAGGFSIWERCSAFRINQNMTWQSSEYILASKYTRIANMAEKF